MLSHSITSALRHAVIVLESRIGEGKRPSRDHAHKVLLPKGRNGKSWLARLMPCGGKYLACRLSTICSISFDILLKRVIAGVCVLAFVMSIIPYYVLLRFIVACRVWAILQSTIIAENIYTSQTVVYAMHTIFHLLVKTPLRALLK